MVEVEEILSEAQSEETSPNTRATAAIQLTDNDNDDDGDGDVDKGRTARRNTTTTTTTREDVVDDAEDHGWQELMGEDIMMKVMIRMYCSNKEETYYNTARLCCCCRYCRTYFFKSFTLSYMAYGFLRSFWSFLF
jgi:hypothetical protein